MSHTLAARCAVCDVVEDPICPECGASSAALHGIADQGPYRVVGDGYIHEWHPECLTTVEDA